MTPKSENPIRDLLPAPVSQITDSEYEAFRKIEYDHSRINLGANKKEPVNARIMKRLRATKIKSFSDYLEFIESKAGTEEFTNFIDSISTNHTFLFREPAHNEFLKSQVFPEFFGGKLKWGNQIRVWNEASSTGEEPYSIAMTLAEAFAARPSHDWKI